MIKVGEMNFVIYFIATNNIIKTKWINQPEETVTGPHKSPSVRVGVSFKKAMYRR